MPELSGAPGELRFVVEVKRAATGETERVEMVGHIVPETTEQEADDGRDSLDSGA